MKAGGEVWQLAEKKQDELEYVGESLNRVEWGLGSAFGAVLAFAVSFAKECFAKTDNLRGNFDVFVPFDVFEGGFEGHVAGWSEEDGVVGTGRANIGEFLFADGVDDHVVIAAVFSDDHAFIDVFAGVDEHVGAFLEFPEGVGDGFAAFLGHEDSVETVGDFAFDGFVFVEAVVHDGFAAGGIEHFCAEADETAGGDGEFDVRHTGAVGGHIASLTASRSDEFHDGSEVGAGDVNFKEFPGFAFAAIDFADDDFGFADGEFVAFAAHGFDEHCEVEDSAPGHFEGFHVVGFFDAECHVGLEFAEEPITEVAAGDKFAVLTCERGAVDGELHGQCGFVDGDAFECDGVERIGDGVADFRVRQSDDSDDVAGFGFGGIAASEVIEELHLFDFGEVFAAIGSHEGDLLSGANAPGGDSAGGNAADVAGPFEGRDHELERVIGADDGTGDAFEHEVEEGADVTAFFGGIVCGVAFAGAGVDVGEVKGGVVSAEFDEEVEGLGENFVGAAVGPVDFVDYDEQCEAALECFLEDEASLGAGAFEGVDEQQGTVCHFEDSFDFTAEVRVSGGVDDIDADAVPHHGDVFGEDGDAAFAFEVVGIQQTGLHLLVFSKDAALFDEAVDQRGFAVVDVSDDGDITDIGPPLNAGGRGRGHRHEGVLKEPWNGGRGAEDFIETWWAVENLC